MAGFGPALDFSNAWRPSNRSTVSFWHDAALKGATTKLFERHVHSKTCATSPVMQAHPATERTDHVEPPPGFAKAVSKSAPKDQHSTSPDDVLASNFGRKLNTEESAGQGAQQCISMCVTSATTLWHRSTSLGVTLAGARMNASGSAQHLGSTGDTSTSGRPSVDSESSSLAPGRQPVQPGMTARCHNSTCCVCHLGLLQLCMCFTPADTGYVSCLSVCLHCSCVVIAATH